MSEYPHKKPTAGFARRSLTSIAGLVSGARRDRSIRELWVVCVLGWAVLALARPPAIWCGLALLAGSLAAATEYLNAALEAALDKLHPQRDPTIGLAKDLASAAAFIMNLTALGVLGLALAG